jgi:hypothetical protein
MKRLSKKGFDANQAFVYIAGILIVAVIFLLGFNAVRTFLSAGEEIEKISFVKDIQAKAEYVSRNYRSIESLDVNLPSSISHMCVIDYTRIAPNDNEIDLTSKTALGGGLSAWRKYNSDPEYAPKNMYFYDEQNRILFATDIPQMQVQPADVNIPVYFFCTDTSYFVLKFEGMDRKAKVLLGN